MTFITDSAPLSHYGGLGLTESTQVLGKPESERDRSRGRIEEEDILVHQTLSTLYVE